MVNFSNNKPPAILHPLILSVPEPDRQLSGRRKVRELSRFARHALTRSSEMSGFQLASMPKDEKGAPLPVNGVYWSLTHKSDAVGAVAAPLPVGIDLEIIRPVSPLMMEKVADDKEWDMVGGDHLKNFFRFWTAKEAVLKAVGRGIAGLSRCRTVDITDDSRMVLIYEGVHWVVEHLWHNNHVVAITPYDFGVNWAIGS